jgi:NADH-quinone oxidoreductase subunit G
MPRVTIDGREIEVRKGTTVLQAAEALGIEVPQMCYHPGLSVVAVCRVCLCRVKGWPKLTPACATEVSDGMEVELYTPELEKARRTVIEFWLLNHPLDCPVCDQGGECPLQDIAFDHGPGVSRLNDPKLKREKRVDLGPHVVLDEERCILCWRCTRFTQEISGSNQIMLRDRGVYTTVGTPPGITFDDPYSGNVVDLCPVGALTSRDFRFRSRVWEMSSSEGICTACSVGCNIHVWSKKGGVERITARPNLQVNDYWLCDRGRFDIHFVGDEKRLRLPRLRVGGELIEVEWSDAVRALADGLKPATGRGQNQAGAIFARHLANEEYWAFQKFLRSVLGSNSLTAGREEVLTPARVDLVRHGKELKSITEIENAEAILILGGDLEKTHPVYALRVRKAVREKGARLFVAAPDPGRLAQVAFDCAVVAGEEASTWLFDLGTKIQNGASEGWAAELKKVKRLVILVNGGDHNASVSETMEAFLGSGLAESVWKTLMLDDGGNVAGSLALGISPHYFPGLKAISADEVQVLKTKWGGRVSGEPGLGWNDLMTAAGEGKVLSLLLVNSGRPVSWGFTAEERKLLARAPFVAAFDLFAEEVEEFAHVILPAPSFAEMDGTTTSADGRVQLARRNIVPKTLTPIQVLHRAAGRLGVKMKGPQPIEVFRELARDVPSYAGLDYARTSGEGAHPRTSKQLVGIGSP